MIQFMIGNQVSKHIVHYLSRHSLQQLSNFKTFLSSVYFFNSKNLSRIPSVSNSLDSDQAQHFVSNNLGPNGSQRLSANSLI